MDQNKQQVSSVPFSKQQREIFQLCTGDDDYISYDEIQELFEMIDYQPDAKEDEQIKILFGKKPDISFTDF